MKTLLLVMSEQRIILDRLYASIQLNLEHCDVVRLSSQQQKNLAETLPALNYREYDRVVVFFRLKKLLPQLTFLASIKGLVILEHDACQNYMSDSKYYGKYSEFYKKLPWVKVIVSGYGVARKLREEGIDAHFVSKGYDETVIHSYGLPRDIEVAFVGSLKNHTYQKRREMLQAISGLTNVHIVKTSSGKEYVDMLNRISIFLSADVGMGEYMIKNFEAMAAGCVLLAWRQGAEEDDALGFIDGENVMLYDSASEAVEKIKCLHNDPELLRTIAAAGQRFVMDKYMFSRVGYDLARVIEQPLRPWPGLSVWKRLWLRLRYGLVLES